MAACTDLTELQHQVESDCGDTNNQKNSQRLNKTAIPPWIINAETTINYDHETKRGIRYTDVQ